MRLCMLSSFHHTRMLCKFEIIVIKNRGTSCRKLAIPIEISGFLCVMTTLKRQHVILKSFKSPIFYVLSNGHSHWVPKISNIFDFIWHIWCTRWIIFEQNNPANENQLKWSLNWMKICVLLSFHQQCMWLSLKVVMIKTKGTRCTKLYHSLRSIGVSTGNTCITSTTYYL